MKIELTIAGHTRQVEITPASGSSSWRIQVDGKEVEADAHLLRPGILSLIIAGQSYRVVLDAEAADPILHLGPHRIGYQVDDPRSLRRRRAHAAAHGPVTLKASMPGRVVRVLLSPGDAVAAHQGVLVIEAMKMQNELKSPKEGRVTQIRVSPGDTVATGDPLALIE